MTMQSYVTRKDPLAELNYFFQITPVCALIGPRQCGKTTTARVFAEQCKGPVHRFDLEDDRDLAKLQDPMLALSALDGLIIIDEVQHAPDLFRILRVLVDEKKPGRQFLILGSASHKLLQQTAETLAGRITYLEMMPFSLWEVPDQKVLWSRGGFPLSYLAANEKLSYDWRRGYVKTFLEQDIPSLGFTVFPQAVRRFWTMLAHYHGQIFNASEIGGSLEMNNKTIQNYLDILESTFMIRRLNPWFSNIKKRQVKSPKIYFRDSGIFHTLIGIHDYDALLNNPKLGASWEGFAMEHIIRSHRADAQDCYFWATHTGAELDLLIMKDGKRLGYEFKYTSSPMLTKSMHIALEDLELDELFVITPNSDTFPMTTKITAMGLSHIAI